MTLDELELVEAFVQLRDELDRHRALLAVVANLSLVSVSLYSRVRPRTN